MVAAALVWPGFVAEARKWLVRPQLAGAWAAIAASLPQPARSRAELLVA